jgi:hypothetical protein
MFFDQREDSPAMPDLEGETGTLQPDGDAVPAAALLLPYFDVSVDD